MTSRRAALPFVLSAVTAFVALAPSPARADLSAEDRAAAGAFFEAGAQAFDAGQYLVAAEAFLKAHGLLKSPALLFSAAQAYRRQYVIDTSPGALRSAVHFYREYLVADPAGKRREDALLALTDLVPLDARLGVRSGISADGAGQNPGNKPGLIPIPVPGQPAPGGTAPPPASPPDGGPSSAAVEERPSEAPRTTRLLLSAKPASAEVSVDGGAFLHVPVVVEVKAGPHAVRVRAGGYHDEELSVPAVQSELVASHIVLQPKPGLLLVKGTEGARVSVDGQVRASLPMDRPITVDPGAHFITVARSGHGSFGQVMTIERDREMPLSVDLPMTGQRIAAWTTFGAGLAGALVGGALAGFMLDRDSAASAIEDRRTTGTLTNAERDEFNNALSSRNDFALAAGVTGGASALVLLGSVGMFLFDEPDVLPVPSRPSDTKSPSPRVEFTVGLSSAAMRLSF